VDEEFPRLLGRQEGKEHGWFERYCSYLANHTKFDWTEAPVPKERIEQINLCLNGVTHDTEIDGTSPPQSLPAG
jgi:hypothetical protein